MVLGGGHFSVIICPLGGSVLGYHNHLSKEMTKKGVTLVKDQVNSPLPGPR